MVAVDDPRNRQFPNPSAKAAGVVLWSLIGCFAWTAASIFLAANQTSLPQVKHGVLAFIMYGGIVTGCVFFGLLVGYVGFNSNAKRTEKLRRAILDGQLLVHWSYPAEQWRQFRRFAEKRENEKWARLRLVTGFFIIVPLIVGGIVGIVRPGNDPDGIVVTVVVCAGCAIVSTVILLGYAHFDNRRRQLLLTPQDSYVSALGAHVNGRWVLWGTAQHRLSDIRIDEGKDGAPACLEFIIDIGQSVLCERVLIPADRMELARKVAEAVKQAPDAKGGGGMNNITTIMQVLTEVLRSFR